MERTHAHIRACSYKCKEGIDETGDHLPIPINPPRRHKNTKRVSYKPKDLAQCLALLWWDLILDDATIVFDLLRAREHLMNVLIDLERRQSIGTG
jgi:hypothetical protein